MSGRQPPPPDVSEDANGARCPGSNPPSPPPPELEGAVGGRRDDNAISFRHFLQAQSDVVPTRHRPQRSGTGSAVDLVDIPMGLPDFVQDHLIAEAHGDGLAQALDLPHFVPPPIPSASSQPRPHHGGINPEDLGAHALNPSPAQNHTSALPDFLSDGPMYASNLDMPSGGSGNGNSRGPGTETRSEAHLRASSFDSDSLASQNERFRREVMEKSRMISYFEAQVLQQENVIGDLRQALATATNALQQRDLQLSTAETEIARLSMQLRRQNPGDSGAASPNGPLSTQGNSQAPSAARVSEIANLTDDLLRQLLDNVSQLRTAALAAAVSNPDDPNNPQPGPRPAGDSSESERKQT